MKVTFNVVEEFLEELRLEAISPQAIPEGIVRLTVRYQQHKEVPFIRHVTILAGVIIRETVVELRQYCGDIWDPPPQGNDDKASKATRDRVTHLRTRIETVATEVGLCVRKGMFEP
jgi:hypothetical protein